MTVARAILVLSSAPLLGCFLTTEPADSLAVHVSVNPTSFFPGDSTRIVVTLTNSRSNPVNLQIPGCSGGGGGVYFAVFDSRGRQVVPTGLACSLEPRTVSYAAREERGAQFTWFGEPWDGTYPDGAYPTELLQPGTYTVRGVLAVGSDRRLSEPVVVQLLAREVTATRQPFRLVGDLELLRPDGPTTRY